jgi:SAM-dependent methyltransferase
MRISSKLYNNNHVNELVRYVNNSQDSIHLLSEKSTNIDGFKNLNKDLHLINEDNLNDFVSSLSKKYDLVIVTDLFEMTDNIYEFFENIKLILKPDGKLLINSVNPKWNRILKFFEFIGLKVSSQGRSKINPRNLNNIAKSSGFDLNQFYSRQLFPFKLGFIGVLTNKFLELLLMPFNLGIKYYMVFAPYNSKLDLKTKSIIIPAKNEEKNLVPLIERIPVFEDDYELIVVYGPSQDKTEDVVNKLSETFPNIKIITLKQSKNGKANAVWEAVSIANNDLIAILDSDQSVDPETLTEFFNILESGNADFVNGTRLIYPMEDKAMRALNTYGNKIFQFLISLVIQQKLSDSLCGTKVFKKTNVIKILNWQKTLKSKDPFGDFDLIFSAAYAGDKILEYPVHYRARVYGETQISRFRDGIKLIRYFLESFYYFNISK